MTDQSTTPSEEQATPSLRDLLAQDGAIMEVGGNQPFLLSDPASAWLVEEGHVDIFFVEMVSGDIRGARQHCCSVKPGEVFFGLSPSEWDRALLAVPLGGTTLRKLRTDAFKEAAVRPEYVRDAAVLLDRWIAGLIKGAISDELKYTDLLFAAGEEETVSESKSMRARSDLVWLEAPGAESLYMDRRVLSSEKETVHVPVSGKAWLWVQTATEVTIKALSTETMLSGKDIWLSLDRFYTVFFACAEQRIININTEEMFRLEEQEKNNLQSRRSALQQMTGVLTGGSGKAADLQTEDTLLQACAILGDVLGIDVKLLPNAEEVGKGDRLPLIARMSGFRTRRVVLVGNWFHEDHGPILAFKKDDGRPVAVVPKSSRGYTLHEPGRNVAMNVSPQVASELQDEAYILYRSLPNRLVQVRDLLRVGLRGTGRDLVGVVVTGVLAALLGLLTPMFTGEIFEHVIPGAHRGMLAQITFALVAAGFGACVFELTKAIALLRTAVKAEGTLETAMWDRLLKMPVSFFRGQATGDLVMRAHGMLQIAGMLKGPAVVAILSGLFMSFNVFVMFYYEWRLALIAVGLLLFAILFVAVVCRTQLQNMRKTYRLAGEISGLVLQLTTGISKLRVAGAEMRAFAKWTQRYADQVHTRYKTRVASNIQTVLIIVYPAICSMVLFASMTYLIKGDLSAGYFLGFNAAFGTFLMAMLSMSTTLTSLLGVVFIYERAENILKSTPETDVTKASPGKLNGRVEINQVCFRYDRQGPLVLDNVTVRAEPGEFVAIVGPSGSGKSTLFRLLLGFDQPEAGSVYYDGQDLTGLDVQGVRRQMGVVLQNGQLMPGDVFSNIIGSAPLTLDDAWRAARLAGLEEDIKELPMQMHTLIMPGAGTFSGGQRQRLMIARAVVGSPRMLLFDEATSALDNRTQSIVSKSIENLQATRIVIAHRLSTIMSADRIYVMLGGKIVQTGTYEQLIDSDGPFKDLASRQLI